MMTVEVFNEVAEGFSGLPVAVIEFSGERQVGRPDTGYSIEGLGSGPPRHEFKSGQLPEDVIASVFREAHRGSATGRAGAKGEYTWRVRTPAT
jgi:hypothetical protein